MSYNDEYDELNEIAVFEAEGVRMRAELEEEFRKTLPPPRAAFIELYDNLKDAVEAMKDERDDVLYCFDSAKTKRYVTTNVYERDALDALLQSHALYNFHVSKNHDFEPDAKLDVEDYDRFRRVASEAVCEKRRKLHDAYSDALQEYISKNARW